MWQPQLRWFTALAFASMFAGSLACEAGGPDSLQTGDHVRDLQTRAIRDGQSEAAHWGNDPSKYAAWTHHSNRLIPVYTFGTYGAESGVDLRTYTGRRSPYRSEEELRRIYGRVPAETLNPNANYMDQTQIFAIQQAALERGKRHIILVIFDGMDWDTSRAAAIHNLGRVAYRKGRGTGLHFLDYTAGGTRQFGFMVTSPYSDSTKSDVNLQQVPDTNGLPGGYDFRNAGSNPWTPGSDSSYVLGAPYAGPVKHAVTDSASSATSMTTGAKTYNAAINVDPSGAQLTTVAHLAQEKSYGIGVVTSVPISHATPAAAYAHNVNRNDFQDLTRDLAGLPSIAHPDAPLSGVDVLIGGGYGVDKPSDAGQGKNFVPGNQSITDDDLRRIDVTSGGRYVVALRQPDVAGAEGLNRAAAAAAQQHQRLFGMFGVGKYKGHLPYRTANGDYEPAPGVEGTSEVYSAADVTENPTLAQMTTAALSVLESNSDRFWLMVEAGDVDWANHDDNLDNSIGAVNSGDAAVKVITDWIESNSSWEQTLLIVTADHGHYLVVERPDLLVPPQ